MITTMMMKNNNTRNNIKNKAKKTTTIVVPPTINTRQLWQLLINGCKNLIYFKSPIKYQIVLVSFEHKLEDGAKKWLEASVVNNRRFTDKFISHLSGLGLAVRTEEINLTRSKSLSPRFK